MVVLVGAITPAQDTMHAPWFTQLCATVFIVIRATVLSINLELYCNLPERQNTHLIQYITPYPKIPSGFLGPVVWHPLKSARVLLAGRYYP